MADRIYESSSDYIIKSVLIQKGSNVAEIRNSVVQLEIFENIELPYLTGKLYFKDDAGAFDSIGFDGVETCEIVFSQPKPGSNDIRKKFVVKSVLDTMKINDLGEAISLYLIEKVGYDGSIDRFSKSYTGTPLEIINKIATEKLGVTINQPSVKPVQKTMKVVIPFLTPLEAIAFVMERMSTKDGLPYYFYSAMNNSLLQIKSLEELLKSKPWNEKKPYRYSRAFTQGHTNNNDPKDAFVVQKYYAPTKAEDTLDLIVKGSIGGNFSIIDATTGRFETKHFDITKIFSKLESNGVVPKGLTKVIETKYDGKDLHSLQSLNVCRSVMVNTYENVNNYYQEDTLDLFELDMVKKAIKSILFKSPINLKVSGAPYLLGINQSIGRQIEYFHLNNNLQGTEGVNGSEDKVKDKKRSGIYMIFSAHHTFFATRHTTELSAVKLGKESR